MGNSQHVGFLSWNELIVKMLANNNCETGVQRISLWETWPLLLSLRKDYHLFLNAQGDSQCCRHYSQMQIESFSHRVAGDQVPEIRWFLRGSEVQNCHQYQVLHRLCVARRSHQNNWRSRKFCASDELQLASGWFQTSVKKQLQTSKNYWVKLPISPMGYGSVGILRIPVWGMVRF